MHASVETNSDVRVYEYPWAAFTNTRGQFSTAKPEPGMRVLDIGSGSVSGLSLPYAAPF